ncbi:MAG TPA: hypothetical protein VHX88_09660 [Solirubrobacteraceae bacterium]|nr:hypothetical protein [Solirubrobacteraceae bacterium]
MKPEQALAHAREQARAARERGEYSEDLSGFQVQVPDRRSHEQLVEWALIEPDLDLVRSTRAWGAPITALKRGAVHVLRQYLAQIESQQSRFNVHMLVRVAELEDRMADLEQWAGRREPGEYGRVDPDGAAARLARDLDVQPAGGDELPERHRPDLPPAP